MNDKISVPVKDIPVILGELPFEVDEALQVRGMYERQELELLLHISKLAGGWGNFLEIGVFLGRSATVLALTMRRYSFGQKLYLIDNMSNPGFAGKKLSWPRDPFVVQYKNGERPEIKNIALFHHDADHNIGPVHKDMMQYLPHLKIGGYVAIHDYGRAGVEPGARDGWEMAQEQLKGKVRLVPFRSAISLQIFRRIG